MGSQAYPQFQPAAVKTVFLCEVLFGLVFIFKDGFVLAIEVIR